VTLFFTSTLVILALVFIITFIVTINNSAQKGEISFGDVIFMSTLVILTLIVIFTLIFIINFILI